MDPQKPNDPNKLIEFIAATVESTRDQMATMQDQMATKSDIARLDGRMDSLEQKLEAGLTAVRGDIERVAVRMDTLDRSVSLRNTAIS